MRQRFQVIQGKRTAEHERATARELPPFEEALLAHLDNLLAFGLRLVGGKRARAEDLVQETCLRAFKGYNSLRSPEKIKSWFLQILVNTHINEFHRLSREPPIIDVELTEALLDSTAVEIAPSPEEQMFERLLDDDLQQALDELPVEFRTVVWLSDVEGLSYKEISEVMDIPTGTVASRLYRGHGLLRERLREYARQHGLIKE